MMIDLEEFFMYALETVFVGVIGLTSYFLKQGYSSIVELNRSINELITSIKLINSELNALREKTGENTKVIDGHARDISCIKERLTRVETVVGRIDEV